MLVSGSAQRPRRTGWFLGAVLSGLALPGVALAGAFPAIAPALETNDDPYAAGDAPRNDRGPPAPPAAPATASAPGSAPPLSSPPAPSPPSPYPAPPPGYYGHLPAAYPPPSYFAAERLAVLDAQIRDLQTRRRDIGLRCGSCCSSAAACSASRGWPSSARTRATRIDTATNRNPRAWRTGRNIGAGM